MGGDQQRPARARARALPPLHSLFGELRNYAHLFQGAADATMEHGEAYEFIRLRLHLERAEKSAHRRRALPGAALDENDRSAAGARDLLRSCSVRVMRAPPRRRSGPLRTPGGRPARRGRCGTASTASTRSTGSQRQPHAAAPARPPRRHLEFESRQVRRRWGSRPRLLVGINAVGEAVTGVLREPCGADRDRRRRCSSSNVAEREPAPLRVRRAHRRAHTKLRLKPAPRGQRCSSFAMEWAAQRRSTSTSTASPTACTPSTCRHTGAGRHGAQQVWTPGASRTRGASPLDRFDLRESLTCRSTARSRARGEVERRRRHATARWSGGARS